MEIKIVSRKILVRIRNRRSLNNTRYKITFISFLIRIISIIYKSNSLRRMILIVK